MAYILESTKYIGIQFSNLSGIYYFLYLLDDIEKTFIEVRTWEGSARVEGRFCGKRKVPGSAGNVGSGTGTKTGKNVDNFSNIFFWTYGAHNDVIFQILHS